MADRPTQLPEWASDPGAEVVEPPEGKKQQGWVTGEKPPAGFFNWWMGLVSGWLAWLGPKFTERAEGGVNVPDGLGTTALDAVAVEGTTPAVRAEVTADADGPAISAVTTRPGGPIRGLYHIGASPPPSAPAEGDVYRDTVQRELRYFDGHSWVTLARRRALSQRHVVDTLGSGFVVQPASGLYMPSFYWDGRRVWLDGHVQHTAGGDLELFTIAAGLLDLRPAQDTLFYSGVVGQVNGYIQVDTSGLVSVGGVNAADVFNVSLAGLSFEVGP